jgi:hypothetical protein
LESWGHGIYRKIHGPQEIKKNMRNNMNIPSEKEKTEQPVIVSRITRLSAWYELTKRNQAEELKVVMKNNVWKTYEWKHYEIQN